MEEHDIVLPEEVKAVHSPEPILHEEEALAVDVKEEIESKNEENSPS